MTHLAQMLASHPRSRAATPHLKECIEACYDCAESCTSCADACLAEQHVQELVRCVRLNLDCAVICAITGVVASRLTEPDVTVLRKQVEACAAACKACGDECQRHADMEHCRLCAEACRRCEQACQQVLQSMAAGARG